MPEDTWLSFTYQFLVGGVLFSLPVIAGLKFKVIKLNRTVDRRLLLSIVGLYFFYFTMQGVWTLLATT